MVRLLARFVHAIEHWIGWNPVVLERVEGVGEDLRLGDCVLWLRCKKCLRLYPLLR